MALFKYARAVEAAEGNGPQRAGLEALLSTSEGSSFLFSGHNINLAHLHLSLMDRDFLASDYEMLSALDEPGRGQPRRSLPEAALASLPSHIHPARPPPSGAGPPLQCSAGPAVLQNPGADAAAAAAAAAPQGTTVYVTVRGLKKDRSKDGSRFVCSVCMEDYAEGDKVKTLPICRHSFHSDCLLPWLCQQGLDAFCPLCKTAVFSQSA